MFLLPHNCTKKNFCEGCSFLGLYNAEKDACIICDPGSPNEEEICKNKFLSSDYKYKKYIGYYLETIDAISGNYQEKSSSGGLVTSLLADLIQKKEIDYAIVVGWSEKYMDFRYIKVDSAIELEGTQRSAYYPISLIEALRILHENEGTCAITCIPSAAKAFELLKQTQPELKNKIKYIVGLTYHSTKTKQYTEYLCKKAGKNNGLEDVIYCSYRDKDKDAQSLHDFVIRTRHQEWKISGKERKGGDWSIGLLQDFSSNFTDDHYCECADISVMDAWHPNYRGMLGTSLAIVRNQKLLNYIRNNTDLLINKISAQIIINSQRSGIEFKNQELAIRLKFYKTIHNICIQKRIKPQLGKNPIKIIKVILRLWIQLIIAEKFTRGKNIENTILMTSKVYWFIQKLDRFTDKTINIIGLGR